MRGRGAHALGPLLLAVLVAAGCGGASPKGRTVTFDDGGAFPPATIVGTYSAAGCGSDARTVVGDARLYYVHSTGGLPPADLYYHDLRLAFAHLQADGCTSRQLGAAMTSGLSARQRAFLLRNVASDLEHAFRAALDA